LPPSGQSRCLWPQRFSMRGRSATAARSPEFRAPTPRAPPGRSSRGTTQNRAAMQPGPGLPLPPPPGNLAQLSITISKLARLKMRRYPYPP
jgi:hypothetical protein